MPRATILICDDEEGVRESLKLILGETYKLTFATNGEEAVTAVRRQVPDLAILDVKMPKMNGLEALRQLRERAPTLKVVMISGYEARDVAAQALALGARDYLTKPFEAQVVQAKVRALLDHA